MPKKSRKRNPHRTQQRRHLHPVGAPSPQPEPTPEELAVFQGLRQALRDDDPVEMLDVVSGFLHVSDSRAENLLDPGSDEVVNRGVLVESFCATPFAETTAALTVMRELLPADDLLRQVIEDELPRRRHPMPVWLSGLAEARVSAPVWTLTHTLGDGDDYLVEVTLPGGRVFTALIYVDHNMGSLVKDAFLIPDSLERVLELMRGDLESGQELEPFDAADARAIVSAAVAQGLRTLGVPESDTWPLVRPAIEWVVSLLPDGGSVPAEAEWTPEEVEALHEEFLSSAHGRRFADEESRSVLGILLNLAASYNVGGPLRWSPVVAEMALLGWFPRKVMSDYDGVAALPEVMRAFVEFAHEREGVPFAMTEQTLDAIDDLEIKFEGAMDEAEHPLAGLFDESAFMRGDLELAVGGSEALANLDDVPLPDEQFAWEAVPDGVRGRVGEYLELLDGVADEHLDVEHRTAMRRFLVRAAAADPAIFRRRSSTPRGAAAVTWAVCRANDTVGAYSDSRYTAQEMLEWFGLTGSVAQRAEPLLRAIGAPGRDSWNGVNLGTPDLLVGSTRRRLMDRRDRLAGG